MLTLPSDDTFLLGYLVSATVLKFIDLVHIFAMQCTLDIYLIDWERPRVPIWRTVLVANEWNEIQTCRKTNPTFTIFVAMLILGVS
ncbi:unnamed protein product [Dibothriocephalus latus]|uniref:G-protein coupled receptors family 1 profile domain-containing protein n=1 Tax=Dibothriocephalus latus TaxID=60516 RepID=A0A3P7Q1H6_DIBLA|nr:unnamed protein product [Dibothriocephalus latus]